MRTRYIAGSPGHRPSRINDIHLLILMAVLLALAGPGLAERSLSDGVHLAGGTWPLRAATTATPQAALQPHRATLLHYVGSNGVEIRRQKVPANLVAITELLLETGSDVNATARVYGGEMTTYSLVATSGHPVRAGLAEELLATLRRYGAGES